MALKVNETSLALDLQVAANTFANPDTSDLMPIANVTLAENGVTVQNPEYTGSVHKQGDIVAGSNVTLSFDVMLRPPGGADVPAADTFLPGRLLRMAKFTESRVAAAIPAAPEALSAGSTTGATLGAGAAGTTDLYKGLLIHLSDNAGGTKPNSMTAIKAYTSGKVATFAETLDNAPAANYQIPKQLAYVRDVTDTKPPYGSFRVWLGGKRYDLIDMSITSFSIPVQTSTRDQANLPIIRVSLSGDVFATADEAVPPIPSLGAVPLFRDGDFWVANKSVGGSSFSLDFAARSAAPPNPNRPNGSDPVELVELRPAANLSLQMYLKATFDPRSLAQAQTYHSAWARWGYTSGGVVSILVSEGRFNFPSPESGGDFWQEGLPMLIDVAAKNISIVFPYW